VAGRPDDTHRIGRERLRGAGHALRHAAHDRQVDVVVRQQVEHAFAVVQAEPRVDARVAATKVDEQHRQEVLGGRHHCQVDPAALQVALGRNTVVQLLQLGERGLRQALEFLAGGGEPDAPPFGFDERHAHRLLELSQLHAHRRLGDVQLVRGTRNGTLARHFHEGIELAQGVATHHDCLMYSSILLIRPYEMRCLESRPSGGEHGRQ
jgi:hypothetical protein